MLGIRVKNLPAVKCDPGGAVRWPTIKINNWFLVRRGRIFVAGRNRIDTYFYLSFLLVVGELIEYIAEGFHVACCSFPAWAPHETIKEPPNPRVPTQTTGSCLFADCEPVSWHSTKRSRSPPVVSMLQFQISNSNFLLLHWMLTWQWIIGWVGRVMINSIAWSWCTTCMGEVHWQWNRDLPVVPRADLVAYI